jgi:4-hydroxy-tetrahydrodipicolinate synthase
MTDSKNFRGAYTALITPFKGGVVDYAQFEQFVEWQVAEGIHGLVPCGTTGESPTLSHAEHKELVARTVAITKGRAKVMAGTGSNSTAEAIEFTQAAEKAGADAALVVAPYYNKPTQEGLYQHYKAIAAATSLPIFIYNIPSRSVINISDATLARLAEIPNIAGVKDATGDLARVATLNHLVGDRLLQFSGEDQTMVGFNAMGGVGVISVLSNLAPKLTAQIQELSLAGKYDEARALHAPLVPLVSALFTETNPIPVKFAAGLMGKCDGSMRLPLVDPGEATQALLREVLGGAALL